MLDEVEAAVAFGAPNVKPGTDAGAVAEAEELEDGNVEPKDGVEAEKGLLSGAAFFVVSELPKTKVGAALGAVPKGPCTELGRENG